MTDLVLTERVLEVLRTPQGRDVVERYFQDAPLSRVPEIPGGQIVPGSVTTVQLADGLVTTAKIVDLGVTTAKLADASVTTVKLADGSVTFAKVVEWPRAVIYRNAAYNAPAAITSIAWDTSEHQTTGYSLWSAGNPNVLDLPVAGRWKVFAKAAFPSNAVGNRQIVIQDSAVGELDRNTLTVVAATTNATIYAETEILSDGTNFFVVRLQHSSTTDPLAMAVGRRWMRVEFEWVSP